MGAKVSYKQGAFTISARKLKGADIFFKIQSVTATETIAMTAIMAEGTTILRNCATEPEIVNLLNYLVQAGAKIKGIGTSTLEITGRKGILLNSKKIPHHQIIPDRIEAGSVLILAALSAKNVTITECNPEHLLSLTETLRRAKVKMIIGANFITIKNQKNKDFRGVKIKTHEYPGFPTDLQSQMGVFMTQAVGNSQIQETIFAGRLDYLSDLKRMGANIISRESSKAIINGPRKLKARKLISPDLRGGFAFIIAAVIAEGRTNLGNAYFVKRGYENIVERLTKIGVDIESVTPKNNGKS